MAQGKMPMKPKGKGMPPKGEHMMPGMPMPMKDKDMKKMMATKHKK